MKIYEKMAAKKHICSLLHGDNPFQRHWLSVTNIEVEIYSMANSGSYILDSDIYLRLLVGMLIAGFATSLKRTMLTLYYGRRNFGTKVKRSPNSLFKESARLFKKIVALLPLDLNLISFYPPSSLHLASTAPTCQ